MKISSALPGVLTLVFLTMYSCSGDREAQSLSVDTSLTRGPEKGSLVIVGGAMRDTSIIDRFIELAGGPDAPIVVIPTASGAPEINNERTIRFLTERGARDVTVVHTYDSLEADTPEFTEPVKRAAGLWFTGGRQWRIVNAYGGTATEEEIRKILERGGVIGGSSAGATIQGTYLARGDTKTNKIMMGDHERGFNYLKASVIDQHLLVRNRQHDLVEVLEAHPHLLGIGLDENTAIIVRGDEFEVMGESFVAIYDYKLWEKDDDGKPGLANGGKFFLLREGDRYNVHERRVIQWSGGSNRDIFAVPDSALVSVQ